MGERMQILSGEQLHQCQALNPAKPVAENAVDGKTILNPILKSPIRDYIPSPKFPAEAGELQITRHHLSYTRNLLIRPDRYVLYLYPGCPWAQRAFIVHKLKGLENVVEVAILDGMEPGKGWCFTGEGKFGMRRDPVFGCKYLREVYENAAPEYNGRILVPTLLDKKNRQIVSNDSGEIIRMFYEAFDHLLPPARREISKGAAALFPPHLREQIDEFNSFIYEAINNGVYKTGFASCQKSYNEGVIRLFEGLDKVEAHLSKPQAGPYLFGDHVTEADVRLFPAIVRFDVVYHTLFKCNLKMIRHDYPFIHDWMRRLYWQDSTSYAFRDTTFLKEIKEGYSRAAGESIIPLGPIPDVVPLSS